MKKVINGETWYYVDTVIVDEVIYDIYENDNGEHFYARVSSLY